MSAKSAILLSPLSSLYRAVTQARLTAYKRGLFEVTKLPVPVVSIGNLTTGGTGKTPLVEWVSRELARRERKVCILTRGYGRENPGARVIVSDGSKVLTSAAEAGDEPFLLAQKLIGLAAVVSDANRVAAGKWAIENFGADVFVLDDGFQHLAMARDLDIVTIDATNPWGGGRLLPAGRLREPRSALARAHCLILTRANQSNQISDLTAALQRIMGGRPILTSEMKLKGIFRINSDHPEEFAALPHQMGAFCAVGNPESFFSLLRESRIEPVFARTFQDHHQYTQSDLTSLVKEAEKAGAQGLITTAKDAVKLQQSDLRLPCYVMKIEISISEEDEIKKLLDAVTG